MKALPNDCTACGACVNICKENAISMKLDSYGFYRPVIDEHKCINCGQCIRKCPELQESQFNSHGGIEAYAVMAEDDVRYISSSGGIFTLMAETVINDGGIVYGCAFDSELKAVHIGVDSIDGLESLRKSKYVESDIGYIYRDVEDKLKSGKRVLFSGVGCQIAGLKSYLGKAYDALFLVKIICDGALPVGVYNRYISEIEKRHGKKITKVDFRNKKYGWICGSLSAEFEDGSTLYENPSEYMKMYFEKVYEKDVCYNCKYRNNADIGDIAIGDFWSCYKYNNINNDKKGISLVKIYSEKGLDLYDLVKSKLNNEFHVKLEITPKLYKDIYKTRRKQDHFYSLIDRYTIKEAASRIMNDKYDIGLVGNWSGCNYGAHLTHYALYNVLSDKGYDVLMIEEPIESSHNNDNIPKLFIENPYPEFALCSRYKNISTMKELNDKCDTFIVGSDQLWRYDMFGTGMMCWTLAFVNSNKRKLSYATSFGNNYIKMSGDKKMMMEFYLKRFQQISVREISGVDICRNSFNGVEAECVLDPVFLCDINHYKKIMEKSDCHIDEPYIFSYIIAPDNNKISMLKNVAEKMNAKIVCVADAGYIGTYAEWGIECVDNCKVEDWLKLIYNSCMVIADSFHAFCFSVIFNKQLISCYETRQGAERIISLSSLLGMHRPYIHQENKDSINTVEELLDTYKIDYETVNRNLDKERIRSINWLENALEADVNYDKNDLIWDMIGLDYMELKEQVRMQKRLINQLRISNGVEIQNKGVILFGAGNCLRKIYGEINRVINIDYICDNDSRKWYTEVIDDKLCIPPEELVKMNNPQIIITIENENVVESVKKQLMNMGITNIYTLETWRMISDN